MKPGTSWEYRIVQAHIPHLGFVYGLHTVYFQDDKVVAWDPTPESFYSASLEGLKNEVLLALGDMEQTIYVAKGSELVPLPGQASRVGVGRKLRDFFDLLNIYRIFF